MVVMAGAMRVAVSFAVACAKDDGDVGWAARRGSVFMLDERGPFPGQPPSKPGVRLSPHRAF
jgi:hypothetical protein